MTKFPPEILKAIKERVNIVELVGENVVLRKSGANYTGLCPFHAERSPSFSVSESKQLYHCYGCKKGGDLVSFVMEIYGIPFPEAVAELAERARIPMPRELASAVAASEDPETQRLRNEAREKRETAYKLNRFAAAFYHQSLSRNAAASRYFRSRGVQGELERLFYVGAAAPAWDALAEHLVSKKAPLPLAVELGLIRPSKRQMGGASGYFDLFRNRAIFPILDMRGKVAGFGGRSLPSDADDGPKYLNSPESLLFQKSRLVFGLYQAQKHIREKDEIVLVEGYFDVLALHAAGFQNVVATCGTALTPEHLAVFKRFASRVTVLFDGDKAGVSATERAMEIGLENGWVLSGAALPEGLDPDELLFDQQTGEAKPGGREAMEAILKQARPLLDARIEDEIREAASGPEEKTRSLKKIGAWLSLYRDPVGREVWAQEIRRRLGVSAQLLGQVVKNEAPRHTSPAPSPGPQPRVAPPKAARTALGSADLVLLRGMFLGGDFVGFLTEISAKLPPGASLADLFDQPACRRLVEFLLTRVSQASPLGWKELGASIREIFDFPENYPEIEKEMQEPALRSALLEAMMATGEGLQEKDFRGALDRGVARAWARFSHRIKTALAQAEAKKDAGLQSQLMKEYLDVQRKMKELTRFYDEA